MKKWERPEIMVEELELKQHVAANCGYIVKPGNYGVHCDTKNCNASGHYGEVIIKPGQTPEDFWEQTTRSLTSDQGHPHNVFILCDDGKHKEIGTNYEDFIEESLFTS